MSGSSPVYWRSHEKIVQRDVLAAAHERDWAEVAEQYRIYGTQLERHPEAFKALVKLPVRSGTAPIRLGRVK